jgi:hydrogenase nickel incorporation protein HypA/HybF
MHEFGIMCNVMDLVLEQARQQEASKVHRIKLKIGELTGVVPEALRFAHEAVTEKTIAEGCQLEIEFVPAEVYCESCQVKVQPGSAVYVCPHCGLPLTDIRAGRELDLVELEVS